MEILGFKVADVGSTFMSKLGSESTENHSGENTFFARELFFTWKILLFFLDHF